MIELFKSLKQWVDNRDETLLLQLLPHFEVLDKFLAVIDLNFAPDLCIPRVRAEFQEKFQKSGSFMGALESIDVEALVSYVALCRRGSKALDHEQRLSQKLKNEDEEEEVPEQRGCIESAKKKRKHRVVGLDDRIDFSASAASHLMKLVTDAMKTCLYQLPEDIRTKNDECQGVVAELGGVHDSFVKLKLDGPEAVEFAKALLSTRDIISTCGHHRVARMHLNADVPVSAMVLKPTFFRKGLCEHHPCRKVSLMSSHVVSESCPHAVWTGHLSVLPCLGQGQAFVVCGSVGQAGCIRSCQGRGALL